MASETIMRVRRATAAAWTSANPRLEDGQIGFETDTRKSKVGDGTTLWNSLSYTYSGGGGGGGLSDGDYGDVTVGGSGTTMTIDNGAVSYAKIQDVSATDKVLGRSTAGAGDVEEIACTAAGRALMDDADAAAQRTTLGLGTMSTQAANAVAITGGSITGMSSPSGSSDVATKAYVDGLVNGLKWKASVRAATTSAGTLATSFEHGDAIDGVTLATGDRILIKDQASGAENGIYVVAASGAPARATDADSAAELTAAAVQVQEGTANGDKAFTCTTDNINLGVTALTFTNFSSASGALLAANNLSDVANAATARTNLGLAIGTNVQAYDAELAALAGVTSAADKGFYFTGSGTGAVYTLTSYARSILDDTTAGDARTTLGVVQATYRTMSFGFGDGVNAIAANTTDWAEVPVDGALTWITILGDQSGSCVIDLWLDSYANFPPTVGDTMVGGGGTKPTVSAATKGQVTSFTGWATTSVTRGSILKLNLDSCSGFTKLRIFIAITTST